MNIATTTEMFVRILTYSTRLWDEVGRGGEPIAARNLAEAEHRQAEVAAGYPIRQQVPMLRVDMLLREGDLIRADAAVAQAARDGQGVQVYHEQDALRARYIELQERMGAVMRLAGRVPYLPELAPPRLPGNVREEVQHMAQDAQAGAGMGDGLPFGGLHANRAIDGDRAARVRGAEQPRDAP